MLMKVAEVPEEFERTTSGRLVMFRNEDVSFKESLDNMLLIDEDTFDVKGNRARGQESTI